MSLSMKRPKPANQTSTKKQSVLESKSVDANENNDYMQEKYEAMLNQRDEEIEAKDALIKELQKTLEKKNNKFSTLKEGMEPTFSRFLSKLSQAYLEELASATECEDLATNLSIVNGERTEPGQTPTVLLTLKYPNVRLNHSIKSLVEADALNIHTSPSALFRVCIKKYFNEQLGYDDRIWTDEDCTATLLMKEYSDEINAIIIFIRNLRGDFNSKIAKAQLTQIRAEKRNKKKNGNIVEKEVDTGKNVSENNESEDEDTSDEDIPPAKKAFITNKLKKTAQTVDSSDEDIPPAKKPFAFEKESIRKFNFKRTTASNILSQGRLADLTDMSIGSSDSNEK